jgi:protoporphyrinogen oxidase
MDKIIILGGGISGLGAAYSLRKRKQETIIIEKDNTYGGLCNNFNIDGFLFDRFIHLSFTKNEQIIDLFNESAEKVITHVPNPYNIYQRKWIKHPAQNNLYPLNEDEKEKIVTDFLNRPQINMSHITNYEDWLRVQYGNYFAEHFPMVYTRKYWMCEAKELETKWIGERLYQPSVEEVITGCKTDKTPITYYAKEMRYPERGGYKTFLKVLADDQDIRYNQKVIKIDTINKIITTESGDVCQYEKLISSIPLPEIIKIINNVPDDIREEAKNLKYTSGYQISIGLSTKKIPSYLWWYIYDKDILPARVYSPSLKSPNNAPEGCSSLQMELYCKKGDYTRDEIKKGSVEKLIEAGIINIKDILFIDIRFEKYANVIFDANIYISRKIVRDYLKSIGIVTIGRFGEWDYLWSDQSLLSGLTLKDNG